MKLVSAQQIVQKGGVKIAIHSQAGMGKTMLAATARRPVVILTEKTGAACLTEANIKKVFGDQAVTTNIAVAEAYTIEDFEEAIEVLSEDERFDTIFIDSASELSKMLLKRAIPNYKNKMQAYGDMADEIDRFIRSLNDCPKNVIFNFHSVDHNIYDEEGDPCGTVKVPGFEGQKMRTDFPFLNGDIFCVVNDFDDEGEEVRMLRTRQGDTPHYAKNRSGSCNELEPMHIQKLIDKMKGKRPVRKPKKKASK